MPTDLPALLRAARLHAGYPSLYALSQATGLPVSSLSELEAGKRSPTIDTLQRICDAAGWELVIEFRPREQRE